MVNSASAWRGARGRPRQWRRARGRPRAAHARHARPHRRRGRRARHVENAHNVAEVRHREHAREVPARRVPQRRRRRFVLDERVQRQADGHVLRARARKTAARGQGRQQGGRGVETAGGVAARPPAEAHAGRRRRAARKRAPAPCNMYIIHRVKHDDFAAGGQQLVRAAGAEEIRQRRADARHGGGGRQRRRGGVGGRLLGAQQRRRIWRRRRPRSRGRLVATRRHFGAGCEGALAQRRFRQADEKIRHSS